MKKTANKLDSSPRFQANNPNDEPPHDAIAHYAYSLWEQQGRPQNQEVAIWMRAETQLRQNRNQHVQA